jgi:hypothetical protein
MFLTYTENTLERHIPMLHRKNTLSRLWWTILYIRTAGYFFFAFTSRLAAHTAETSITFFLLAIIFIMQYIFKDLTFLWLMDLYRNELHLRRTESRLIFTKILKLLKCLSYSCIVKCIIYCTIRQLHFICTYVATSDLIK